MAAITEGSVPIALEGARRARGNLTKARIRWVIVALVLVFGVVAGRLVQLGTVVTDSTIEGVARDRHSRRGSPRVAQDPARLKERRPRHPLGLRHRASGARC